MATKAKVCYVPLGSLPVPQPPSAASVDGTFITPPTGYAIMREVVEVALPAPSGFTAFLILWGDA